MKYCFIALFLGIFNIYSVYAQNNKVDAICITNENDTIRAKVIVVTNLFDKTLINELSLRGTIRFVDETGKGKLKESSIKYLEFIDFKDNKRVFVSKASVPKLKNSNILYEQVAEGKLSCYKRYYPHAYDGSVMEIYYFYMGDEEVESVSVFSSLKKVLKRLILTERPNLLSAIDNIRDKNTTERRLSIQEIVTLYNQ